MNILQIDHLGIAVNSLEEGQAFWCDIMGLKMAFARKKDYAVRCDDGA